MLKKYKESCKLPDPETPYAATGTDRTKTIKVTYQGSYFEIDRITGKVLAPECEREEPFDEYDRADIQEYMDWAHNNGLPMPDSVHILGLRWIRKDGEVEEHEEEWRQDLLKMFMEG